MAHRNSYCFPPVHLHAHTLPSEAIAPSHSLQSSTPTPPRFSLRSNEQGTTPLPLMPPPPNAFTPPIERTDGQRLTSSYAFVLASSASCSRISLVDTTPLNASLHEATSVKLIAIPNDSSTYPSAHTNKTKGRRVGTYNRIQLT
jgi:hypothetical protein